MSCIATATALDKSCTLHNMIKKSTQACRARHKDLSVGKSSHGSATVKSMRRERIPKNVAYVPCAEMSGVTTSKQAAKRANFVTTIVSPNFFWLR